MIWTDYLRLMMMMMTIAIVATVAFVPSHPHRTYCVHFNGKSPLWLSTWKCTQYLRLDGTLGNFPSPPPSLTTSRGVPTSRVPQTHRMGSLTTMPLLTQTGLTGLTLYPPPPPISECIGGGRKVGYDRGGRGEQVGSWLATTLGS